MKVNRQNTYESYNTTAEWLSDFCKTSDFIDSVKKRRDIKVQEKFATIEEKMEDIRARIGYSNGLSDTVIKSASNTCECGVCDTCIRESKVDSVVKVIKHINSIQSANPFAMPIEILNIARENLGENSFCGICTHKLNEYISSKVKVNAKDVADYTPIENVDIHEFGDNEVLRG